MKTQLLLGAFILLFVSLQAQDMVDSVNSGPSFRAFSTVGLPPNGWNTANFNDSAWFYAHNGAGTDDTINNPCLGPNTSIWGGADTCIWTHYISISPDTGYLRASVGLPKCGKVIASEFSIVADDYYTAYINGNLLGTQAVSNVGDHYTLDSTQLSWFTAGNNIMAFQVINSSPDCGKFALTGSVTVDTLGCYLSAGISDVHSPYISISPNPTTGTVVISHASGLSYSVTVFDMLGHIVRPATEQAGRIDLSAAPDGIYIVQLTFADGTVTNRKVIKQ